MVIDLKTKFKGTSQQCLPPVGTLYIFPTSVTVCLRRPSFAPAGLFANFDVRRRTHKQQLEQQPGHYFG
jgi:hypothetical protein